MKLAREQCNQDHIPGKDSKLYIKALNFLVMQELYYIFNLYTLRALEKLKFFDC